MNTCSAVLLGEEYICVERVDTADKKSQFSTLLAGYQDKNISAQKGYIPGTGEHFC
jgi:hypothetical protein